MSSDDSFISSNPNPKKRRNVVNKKPLKKPKVSKTVSKDLNSRGAKCPVCKKTDLKNVLLHIARQKMCKSQISDAQMQYLQTESKLKTAKRKKEFDQSLPKERIKNKNKKYNNDMKKKDMEGLRNRRRMENYKYIKKQNPEVLKLQSSLAIIRVNPYNFINLGLSLM